VLEVITIAKKPLKITLASMNNIHSKCENIHCRTYMSLEWYKSFGFKEFDK
jgi:hypothetical protein